MHVMDCPDRVACVFWHWMRSDVDAPLEPVWPEGLGALERGDPADLVR